MKLTKEINPFIFRGYDIRGVYPRDLNEDVAYTVGRSFGSKLRRLGHINCMVARDNRFSSLELSTALIKGILDSGVDVVDLGLTTTPMYYYACICGDIPRGVMVTASHNPKDENGFKFAFDESGNACGEIIQEFLKETLEQKFTEGSGRLSTLSIEDTYLDFLLKDIKLGSRPLKVIVDCGNGTTALFAKKLFSRLPIDLEVLYGDSDPSFPNHHPDPSVEENLEVLKRRVLEIKADVGISFDGDGDRLGVINDQGEFVPMDQYMIMMTRSILPTSINKKVLVDVKCSKTLSDEIVRLGGESLLSRVGNSYTKRNTMIWNCIFGGELSGHIYFRDKFLGFDSGMYAGLRLIELLSFTNTPVSGLLSGIPKMLVTPEIKIASSDSVKFQVIDKVLSYSKEKGYPVNDIDGVRLDFENGWVGIRASNTGPNITFRAEASSLDYLLMLKSEFLSVIEKYNHFI